MPANPTDSLNGHALAGLIDAEAHFAIAEHNGGSSVSCTMVLAMRDDDVDLLHGAVRTTGLGTVRAKDQRGNPQAAWIVYRRDDASALADYLQRFPLRSLKRLDFEVWRTAVRCWVGFDAGRLERLKELRRAIFAARTYRVGGVAYGNADNAGFDEWLGGFVAGDGCFHLSDGRPRLTVRLRADDAPLLAKIRDLTGAGHLNGPYPNRAAHPSVAWAVTRSSELVALAERFDGRIPGRKKLEFDVWRLAVAARADRSATAAARRELIAQAARELEQLRCYGPGGETSRREEPTTPADV